MLMTRRTLNAVIGHLLLVTVFLAVFVQKAAGDGADIEGEIVGDKLGRPTGREKPYSHVRADDSIAKVINHPAFEGFGRFLLPSDNGSPREGMLLRDVAALLPYHNHVDPETTVVVLNHMIDEINAGKTVFYDFYTPRQKIEDPTKAATGLFFFRGSPQAPFAIVCPGGGFSYVGSIHEGFPHALSLSMKGYNAFVLQYRVGSEFTATEDLGAALSYVFAKAKTLGVRTRDYSLWGSSAGARMVANIASNGAVTPGGGVLPKPCIVVMAYTGHTVFSVNDPPTFVTVSEDDRIVNVSGVERRVNDMRSAGIEVEYRRYRNAGHGFGLGLGTDAAGWIEHATEFWKNHTK